MLWSWVGKVGLLDVRECLAMPRHAPAGSSGVAWMPYRRLSPYMADPIATESSDLMRPGRDAIERVCDQTPC